MSDTDPHADGSMLQAGAPLEQAEGLIILLHGRGGSARDILGLQGLMDCDPKGHKVAWLAPEASGRSWYPQSFLAPRQQNEPYLTSALKRVVTLIQKANEAGITNERIIIGGFSQGACLTTQFAASHPARYGGLIAFTGGLVGPLGSKFEFAGDLGGTPALLLSGDPDPHVPWTRVEETAEMLRHMGAEVTLRCFPGRPHIVSPEELQLAKSLIESVFVK